MVFTGCSDYIIQIGEELIFFHPITKEKLGSDFKIQKSREFLEKSQGA